MANETKRRTPLILGICIAVVVVVVICILVFVHPWNGASESGDDVSDSNPDVSQQAVSADNSGVSKDIVSVVADGSVPLLSDWEYFDTYWQKCDPTDATYCETSSDGAAAYYRLCDDYSAGQGIGSLTILEGAKQTNADDAWDVVTLDCTTGENTWWTLDPQIASTLRSFEDPTVLEANDLIAFGKGWMAYVDYPVKDEMGKHNSPAEEIELSDEEACELLGAFFAIASDYQKQDIVRVAEAGTVEGLMEALIAEYGEEEIMKYSSKEEGSDNE